MKKYFSKGKKRLKRRIVLWLIVAMTLNSIPINDAIAHATESGIASLASGDDSYSDTESDFFNNGDYRMVRFNGPVDVDVYNEDLEIVASIVNDTPISIDGSSMVTSIDENGEMIIYPPPNGDYTFCITPTSDGNMTYTINELCYQLGEVTRLINYYDIPIKQNSTILGSLPAYSSTETKAGTVNVNGSSTRYDLSYAEGDTIPPSEELCGEEATNSLYMVSVSTEDEENSFVTGGGEFLLGNYAQVEVTPLGGYQFTGWYSEGTCISTEKTYRFCVRKEVTLSAKFTPENEAENAIENETDDTVPTYTPLTIDTKALVDKITVNGVASITNVIRQLILPGGVFLIFTVYLKKAITE